jgi:hypothetical protein
VRRLVVALALALTGCAADLGGGVARESPTGHGVVYGRVAVSTRFPPPLNVEGALFGLNVESRSEPLQGSRFLGGVTVGYGTGPMPYSRPRCGHELYLEFGTVLGSTLFDRTALYGGLAAGLPIRLDRARDVRELNDHSFVIHRTLEVVPTLRLRGYHANASRASDALRGEGIFTVSLRLRFVSDFL